jgi:hypothetical protein
MKIDVYGLIDPDLHGNVGSEIKGMHIQLWGGFDNLLPISCGGTYHLSIF